MANYRKDERPRGTEQPGSGYGTAPGEELDYPGRADGFNNPMDVLRAMAAEQRTQYEVPPGGFGLPGGEFVPGTRSVGIGQAQAPDGLRQTGASVGKKIGADEIGKARERLQKYKSAKSRLDSLIKEAEEWFTMHEKRPVSASDDNRKRRRTNWLMSSIVQKHADFMDNVPEVTVLPREKSDQNSAQQLTSLLPAVMERGAWDAAYHTGCWHKLKFGFAVYAVLWDNAAYNGLGDVAYRAINPLAIYWEPGITKLQDSHDVFFIELKALDDVKAAYPDNPEVQELSAGATENPKFLHDPNVDTSDKVTVIDWYYKKNGTVHYCKYVGDVVLYSTENEGNEGLYRDGRYPFVIDAFLPDETGPAGIGLYQLGIDTQLDLDDSNDLFMKNLKVGARSRYFSAVNGGINEAEFSDLTRDIVHVAGGQLDERYVKPIEAPQLSGNYLAVYESKVNELKENTFNRDVNAGGTSGTSTASGIAALQEAGSKTSRDAIRNTYRAFTEIVDMTVERIKQFYDAPRSFRILGPNAEEEFASIDNSALGGGQLGAFGEELGQREPIFDYDVRISKQSVYSRSANNQEILQFFNMGFFNPANATQALACLEVLQLDNKNKLTEIIKQNSLLEQFKQQILPALIQAAGAVSPELQQAAAGAAQAAGLLHAPEPSPDGRPEAQGPKQSGGMSYMDRQRAIANDRSAPG